MIVSKPAAADILCASATATTATLITVPASRWYTCDIMLCVTSNGAQTTTSFVTWTPNDGSSGPATTTVMAKLTAVGPGGASGENSSTISAIIYGGATGGVLSFTAGTGVTSVNINGFLL